MYKFLNVPTIKVGKPCRFVLWVASAWRQSRWSLFEDSGFVPWCRSLKVDMTAIKRDFDGSCRKWNKLLKLNKIFNRNKNLLFWNIHDTTNLPGNNPKRRGYWMILCFSHRRFQDRVLRTMKQGRIRRDCKRTHLTFCTLQWSCSICSYLGQQENWLDSLPPHSLFACAENNWLYLQMIATLPGMHL